MIQNPNNTRQKLIALAISVLLNFCLGLLFANIEILFPNNDVPNIGQVWFGIMFAINIAIALLSVLVGFGKQFKQRSSLGYILVLSLLGFIISYASFTLAIVG